MTLDRKLLSCCLSSLLGGLYLSLIFWGSFVIYFIQHRGSSVHFSGVNYGLKNDA